jgi:hypothetical protein
VVTVVKLLDTVGDVKFTVDKCGGNNVVEAEELKLEAVVDVEFTVDVCMFVVTEDEFKFISVTF